jgi:hypothetical protein
MAVFGESLRGDGLFKAQRALTALEDDPQQLDRARDRFGDPPPSYTSHQSHSSTRSQSPDPPSEEQRRREERRWELKKECEASFPRNQFNAQSREELKRIFEDAYRTRHVPIGTDLYTLANEELKRTYEGKENQVRRLSVGSDPYQLADEIVKKRWVEQGIWKDEWDDRHALSGSLYGRWKHEEPLEPESESEKEAETSPSVFSFNLKKPQPKPKQLKSNEERRRIAEPRATLEREREASRPFYQFVYQISKERERIQAELGTGGAATTVTTVPDINTGAYENVKSTWIKRGIWNGRWGILPGMSWKHEELLVDETSDDTAPLQMLPLGNGSCEAGEAPTGRIFGSPSRALLENGTAEGERSATNSPHSGRNRQVLRSTAVSTSLGPAHSSKVSKARKKRPVPRPHVSQQTSSSNPPLLTRPDIAEPELQTVRRSKRVADNPKSIGSAKPKGISKKSRSSTTRGRRRKSNNN